MASRGIFAGEKTFKAFGFTRDEESRWQAYGVGPVDAMKVLSMGITLDVIDQLEPYQQEWFKEAFCEGSALKAMYVRELAQTLEDESNNYYTREQDEIDEFDRNGNRDLQHAARKSLRKELMGVNDEDVEVDDDGADEPYIEVSGSKMSSVSSSKSYRSRRSSKKLLLKSNNG